MRLYRKAMSRLAVSMLRGLTSEDKYEAVCESNRSIARTVFDAVMSGDYVAHYWLYGHKVHAIAHTSTRKAGAIQISLFDSIGALSHVTITSIDEMDKELPEGAYVNIRMG